MAGSCQLNTVDIFLFVEQRIKTRIMMGRPYIISLYEHQEFF
jgi:hypothetical protein